MAIRSIPSGEFRSIQQELHALSAVVVTDQNKQTFVAALLNLKERLYDFTSCGSGIGSAEIIQCKENLDRVNDAFLRGVFASIEVPQHNSYGFQPQPTLPIPTTTRQELDLNGFRTDREIDSIFQRKRVDELKAFFNTVEPGRSFVNCMQGINRRPDRGLLFRELLDTVLNKHYPDIPKLKQYFELDDYTDQNTKQAMFAFTHVSIRYALEQIPAGCANLLVFFSNTNALCMINVICNEETPFLETLTPDERKKFLQWAKENENAPCLTDRTPYYQLLTKGKN